MEWNGYSLSPSNINTIDDAALRLPDSENYYTMVHGELERKISTKFVDA